MWTIYRHVHRASGKCYVGLTKFSIEKRWIEHVQDANGGSSYLFHRALRAHGLDAFDHDVLESVGTLDDANFAEEWWIAHFGSDDPKLGYNLSSGGKASNTHPETLAKMSEAQRARFASMSPEARAAIVRKMRSTFDPVKHSERMKKRLAERTPEQVQEWAAKVQAKITTEQHAERARRVAATKTPEERREVARKGMANRDPARVLESAQKAAAAANSRTPEQRREAYFKGRSRMTPDEVRDAHAKSVATRLQNSRARSQS